MQTNTPTGSAELNTRLTWSLLALRITVFVVMFVWTLDKFVNPAHGAKIMDAFYGIGNVPETMIYLLGGLQLILVLAFVAGLAKRFTYGLVFILHGLSTLSSYPQYLDAFNNLLFFAAWPMWGACLALYLLREADTKFTLGK
ncbi:hypothetical protein [Alteromonas ponticola]|uniref:DoxX family protein n=1 Tax=Alteromonas ponticola TaxID=2720613 RepID=A0ABX1R068_9ALTE|nr:hypothetical protein [Alteromonas ponticola]NMH59870.1 hypothetical protein [Alteromonas ponticola]